MLFFGVDHLSKYGELIDGLSSAIYDNICADIDRLFWCDTVQGEVGCNKVRVGELRRE